MAVSLFIAIHLLLNPKRSMAWIYKIANEGGNLLKVLMLGIFLIKGVLMALGATFFNAANLT